MKLEGIDKQEETIRRDERNKDYSLYEPRGIDRERAVEKARQ